MQYSQFLKKLDQFIIGQDVVSRVNYFESVIHETNENKIFIDGKETMMASVNEAKEYIRHIKLREELSSQFYEEINDIEVANIIREFHDVKVTNTLIESYIDLAASKTFSVDPVISNIRSLNYLDVVTEDKIDYVLNDNNVVTIDKDTQSKLNTILDDKYQVVEYMRESKENFMDVIREISRY